MSLQTEVQALAIQAGHKQFTKRDAEWVKWERTGYPSFFMSDTPHAEMLEQARQYLNGEYFCPSCSREMKTDDGGWNLCQPCLSSLEKDG